MKDIITGAVYAVDLHGAESYEFKGIHPALIVRMLKEENMYYVVPLTTYTKDRWDKCRKKGFGKRIVSSNSIARVDKLNIVSEKQVQGRYYNAGHLVVLTEQEVEDVLKRVEEYISLSNSKTQKEYEKFIFQRKNFEKDMDILLKDRKFEEFLYPFDINKELSFSYPCTKLSKIGNSDIKDIISEKVSCSAVTISKQENNMNIRIKIDNRSFLTFLQEYDKFKEQKGDKDM